MSLTTPQSRRWLVYLYGNSTIMPYSQQFFIGGSNSLRGFRRSIGGYQLHRAKPSPTVPALSPDESGDISPRGPNLGPVQSLFQHCVDLAHYLWMPVTFGTSARTMV